MKMMFFLRLNYLDMHRTYGCAANPQRTRPLCDFCGRKFCQPQKLKVHIKRMHSVGGFGVVVNSEWVGGFDVVVGSGRCPVASYGITRTLPLGARDVT
ncbi:hypothetical protein Pmani_032156 [Petrolisthes manimaculis]|uniref:C2H2-type domain-containing protein n=1 Tax=Petrolisthes manimaculis TaxID=1843537 RepID=A0AAE1TU26_9EUCA|nr:hypothetical protein Pmani_032156 [Petrolisthes manimaculis]